MPAALDQQLLYGLLVLQNGLIDRAQFVAAFQAWTGDKARTLSEHLSARGDIDGDDHRLIEALVARLLQAHDNDAARSLASLAMGDSTREALAAVGDPQLEVTLELVGSGSHEAADRAVTFSVGTASTGAEVGDGALRRLGDDQPRGAVFVRANSIRLAGLHGFLQ